MYSIEELKYILIYNMEINVYDVSPSRKKKEVMFTKE